MTDATGQLARFAEYAGLIGEFLRKTGGAAPGPLDEAASVLQNVLGFGGERDPKSGRAENDSPGNSCHAESSRAYRPRVSNESWPKGRSERIRDAHGHTRAVYRPLALHAGIAACDLNRSAASDDAVMSLHSACESAAQELERCAGANHELAAARGHEVAESAWWGLALFCAGRLLGRLTWTERAADVLMSLVAGQQKSGALLSTTASDNPETHWYHELVILHALAGYAVRAEDRLAARAVERATGFHLNETQPDHATTQPWGLFAFIWNPDTQMLADSQLHAARTQHPEGADPVTRILLADTLVCLRAFSSQVGLPRLGLLHD